MGALLHVRAGVGLLGVHDGLHFALVTLVLRAFLLLKQPGVEFILENAVPSASHTTI